MAVMVVNFSPTGFIFSDIPFGVVPRWLELFNCLLRRRIRSQRNQNDENIKNSTIINI
jgi:hypothetical protein